MELTYKKRDNSTLFKDLESPEFTNLETPQNYVPLYDKFFKLTNTNNNTINLNHKKFIKRITKKHSHNKYSCIIGSDSGPDKSQEVFFKFSPLLDPLKYVTGKYKSEDASTLMQLPSFSNNNAKTHYKIMCKNNAAYVDSFFTYLTSQLKNTHGFLHGVDFYGSFLGIKSDHMEDVQDDIDYLEECEYFRNNIGNGFSIDVSVFGNGSNPYQYSRSNKPKIQTKDNIDIQDSIELPIATLSELSKMDTIFKTPQITDCTSNSILEPIYQDTNSKNRIHLTANSSSSNCSSRSSNTGSDEESDNEDSDHDSTSKNKNRKTSTNESDVESECSDSESSEDDEPLWMNIDKFPVQMIALECCENTLDSLIKNIILSDKEWGSIVIQILMSLIAYQKTLKLTHNDLHGNNIMYMKTDKKHLFYKYNNNYYKVPTFGRIFKIIDYGRAIYQYKGIRVCSDSFHKEGDAATQYNCEPFLDSNKPRLEPNFSFDLCRLGCSIFDYLIGELKEVEELDDSPIIKIITDWCKDDKGRNIMYKLDGQERYPEFKLYKMIARTVHNHSPDKVLKDSFFERYLTGRKATKKHHVMDIDVLPEYHKSS